MVFACRRGTGKYLNCAGRFLAILVGDLGIWMHVDHGARAERMGGAVQGKGAPAFHRVPVGSTRSGIPGSNSENEHLLHSVRPRGGTGSFKSRSRGKGCCRHRLLLSSTGHCVSAGSAGCCKCHRAWMDWVPTHKHPNRARLLSSAGSKENHHGDIVPKRKTVSR